MINARHTGGCVDHVRLPPIHRPCHQVAKHGVNILWMSKWYQLPYFLLSLQFPFVQLKSHVCGKTRSSWAPQHRSEKCQSHPQRFYCVVVSVAAAHSLDKKRPGKSIIAWVFVWLVLVRGLFQHLWAVPSSDSLLCPQGSFPSYCHTNSRAILTLPCIIKSPKQFLQGTITPPCLGRFLPAHIETYVKHKHTERKNCSYLITVLLIEEHPETKKDPLTSSDRTWCYFFHHRGKYLIIWLFFQYLYLYFFPQ